ncbi:cytochrome b5-like heme steroid binding domain containing protein [Stylonychia lemnae]|uniref:Cytochrome b5-like heme steroid binding domain containing protein n=1 Tax=Stylonychia lemnae TaxID=5949 RepID=A0A078ASK4_STYLE|nr:cytochrome b5-like heme steroid binding domain containing protein [Stylonychia lemnae]|eukprot:CDW84971.1 cytochrome b5-like heme steroid binding domain containing protein [Stylonychia lemnae]
MSWISVLILLTISASLRPPNVSAQQYQDLSDKTLMKTFGKEFNVKISVVKNLLDGQEYLKINTVQPDKTYLGLGFGQSMTNAQIMIFIADGTQSNAAEYFSPRATRPTKQDNQNLASTFKQNGTHVEFTAYRKFKPDDVNDKTLSLNSLVNMIYAFRQFESSESVTLKYHGGDNRGIFKIFVDLSGGISDASGEGYSEDDSFDFYVYHGWLMWVSWGLFGLIQLASNRYLKMYWKVNMWVHRLSGSIIWILTLVFGFIAVSKADWEVVNSLHTIIGFIVTITVTLIVLGGVFTRSMMNRLRWKTHLILKIKFGHRMFGLALITLSQFSILTGGLKYSTWAEYMKPLPITHISIFFLTSFVIEIIHQRYKTQEQPFRVPDEIMTMEEFKSKIQNGSQYVLLDDLVLDVSKYMSNHPGGRFVMEYNVGRDISKYFYGGYILENSGGLSPHYHSNVARKIVNSLIIARIDQKPFQFMARIVEKSDVNSTTATFTFRIQKQAGNLIQFQLPASNDISTFGKHFLVKSIANPRVKRQYTLASCMNKHIYEQYVKNIEKFTSNQDIQGIDESFINQSSYNDNADIYLTIKNYDTRSGLSRLIHQQKDVFEIKALMGKGLDVQRQGTHLAFVAGTGILVFMDLVAFILRQNLGLLQGSDNQILDQKNFKFVLYASFPSPEDSIGLELLQGLQKITQMQELKNFELILRFSNEFMSERWNAQFIERQVEIFTQNKQIKKIWVCGPPMMNEVFDRTFEEISQQYDLDRSIVEIL